ncbi:MAG: lysoplasmalogenase [Prolixibacteraceae bacterium]|nr:lysoplasmalogenase [Prolixibacteraceae bacterium]
MIKKIDYKIFLLIFVADLVAIALHLHVMEQIVKPLILIWIMVVFIRNARAGHPVFKTAIAAFALSLIGDVLLMLPSQSGIFFLAGMGAFFVSHLFFILTFTRTNSRESQLITRKPVVFLPVILTGIVLYLLLFPHLDLVMKIAVLGYAIAITGMVFTALNRKGRVGYMSFLLLFIGAVLFFISDSLLAVNKFWYSIPASGIMIMSTYMAAQFLIMLGLVRQTGASVN